MQKITRSQANAMAIGSRNHRHFARPVKKEVENEHIEKVVRDKRKHTTMERIDEESVNRVPDTGFFRSKDTEYMKLIKLYWLKFQQILYCPSY